VKEVAERWLEANPSKREIVRLHLVPALGRRPIGSVTPRDVQGLVNDWIASGKRPRTVLRQYGYCGPSITQPWPTT
jgi:hypothetical protein